MSEQQAANGQNKEPHFDAVGKRWGDPISEERRAELRALFERQKEWVEQSEATRGESVFEGVRLTGADAYWLAEAPGRDAFGVVSDLQLEGANLSDAQLEGANLSDAQLKGANLSDAQLKGANLYRAQLKGASLYRAQLERADLYRAQLERADLRLAQLERADLRLAQLERADLRLAQLERADLIEAHLEEADLSDAQLKETNLRKVRLEGANLVGTQLAGAKLIGAQLTRANLTGATFDKTTRLNDAVLTGASLDQVTYDGVNLTVVDWSLVPVLGDELTARQRKNKDGKRKDRAKRGEEYAAAVRANRVLAVTLRSQGMNEDADRYAYRAQLLQRRVLRLRRRWGAAFGSWLLDLVSGYGYKPVRSLITYATTIAVFAVLYWCVTNDISLTHGLFTQALLWLHMTPPTASHQPLQPYEAVVVSMTSFHGRGFFQPMQSPGDKVAILAAIEAAVGLLIEIVFIATFTQRFFAR